MFLPFEKYILDYIFNDLSQRKDLKFLNIAEKDKKTSVKVHHTPGGASSIVLGGDNTEGKTFIVILRSFPQILDKVRMILRFLLKKNVA